MSRVIAGIVAAADKAAAVFLAIVTLLTFVDVMLRYLAHSNVPDGFDFGRMALCIALFWGIAGCCYRGEHIEVDVFWTMMPPWARRLTDYFATSVIAAFMVMLSWMTVRRVLSILASNQTTADLGLRLWPFYAVATIGIVVGTLLLVTRFIAIATTDYRKA